MKFIIVIPFSALQINIKIKAIKVILILFGCFLCLHALPMHGNEADMLFNLVQLSRSTQTVAGSLPSLRVYVNKISEYLPILCELAFIQGKTF